MPEILMTFKHSEKVSLNELWCEQKVACPLLLAMEKQTSANSVILPTELWYNIISAIQRHSTDAKMSNSTLKELSRVNKQLRPLVLSVLLQTVSLHKFSKIFGNLSSPLSPPAISRALIQISALCPTVKILDISTLPHLAEDEILDEVQELFPSLRKVIYWNAVYQLPVTCEILSLRPW